MSRKIKQLIHFIKDREKKPYSTIIREMRALWKRDGSFPFYYFTRYIYKKDAGYYEDYLNMALVMRIRKSSYLHKKASCALIADKFQFFRFAVDHSIAVPEIYFHNKEAEFYLKDKQIEIGSFQKFQDFLNNNLVDVFIKPKCGIRGQDCFKIEQFPVPEHKLLQIYNAVRDGEFIFQELIRQHPVLNKINPSCINTLRIDTYKDEKNRVHLMVPFLRVGMGDKVTDNTSTDGFIVKVDLNTGKLADYGLQYLNANTHKIYKHPVSRAEFGGMQIPAFQKVKELAIQTARTVQCRLVGWDIALSENGPLIVEGNCDYAMQGQDILNKGYKSHPVMHELLTKHFKT